MPLQSTRGAGSAKGFGFGAGASPFIIATGGTVTEDGDYKIHTFTGPGSFVITNAGSPANKKIDYLVVAGGGGSGNGDGPDGGGGGGAGGFRVSNSWGLPAPSMSPLSNPTGLSLPSGTYPITVGAGGAGASSTPVSAVNGNPSIFSTITSAGGGKGANFTIPHNLANPGGSGGGAHQTPPIGLGNDPPTSPPQGNDGGYDLPAPAGSGGGGAGAVGNNANGPSAGPGGVGSYVSPSFAGSNGTTGPVPGVRYFSGGGAGANSPARAPSGTPGTGGSGGGGNQTSQGTANTGGGAGGGANNIGSTGGSGIVIIRYKFK
jgi:hypothetical protein